MLSSSCDNVGSIGTAYSSFATVGVDVETDFEHTSASSDTNKRETTSIGAPRSCATTKMGPVASSITVRGNWSVGETLNAYLK